MIIYCPPRVGKSASYCRTVDSLECVSTWRRNAGIDLGAIAQDNEAKVSVLWKWIQITIDEELSLLENDEQFAVDPCIEYWVRM